MRAFAVVSVGVVMSAVMMIGSDDDGVVVIDRARERTGGDVAVELDAVRSDGQLRDEYELAVGDRYATSRGCSADVVGGRSAAGLDRGAFAHGFAQGGRWARNGPEIPTGGHGARPDVSVPRLGERALRTRADYHAHGAGRARHAFERGAILLRQPGERPSSRSDRPIAR